MILMTDFFGQAGVLVNHAPNWARELDLFLMEASIMLGGRLKHTRKEKQRRMRKQRKQIRRRKTGRR